MKEAYRVKLEAFEGPLDLLLHLVRKNEVEIYDLPIATITDQYLGYIEMFEELNLDVAGEYLVMAASLMYMKSRLLLPSAEDEEDDDEDPVGDLVRQLAEYQKYREAADELRDRVLLDRDVFRRSPTAPTAEETGEQPGFRPVELADLFSALRDILERAVARKPHTVGGDEHSVADAVRTMIRRLRQVDRMPFTDLFSADSSRGYIVAIFIGLLEMMKLQVVEGEQAEIRGPIFLRLIDPNPEVTLASLTDTYGSGREGDTMDSPSLETVSLDPEIVETPTTSPNGTET